MNRPIVVAQAVGPAVPSSKTVTVTKPDNNQAIAIHLDGSTRLDLTAIANESITLVHVGDRLIILFDNHAEVVIEPFFGDNGQPLPDITVELGPGHDVTAAQFAIDFPITTDASVVPASGGPNSIAAGANFVSFTIDSLAPSGTPLGLLGSEGANGGAGGATDHENVQIVPMSLTGARIAGAADEGGLTATVDEFGTGSNPTAHTVATGVPGSLFALVDFGTGGPNGSPFGFVAPTEANAWLANLGLISHGAAIDTATINGTTLIASTDPAAGTPHEVFSLTINASGGWTFTLLAPIDDVAGHGTNTATIDLSGLIQAVDAAGLTITLANDFTIVVADDVPLLTGATDTSHGVEEAALGGKSSPGDLYGTGNDPTHANGLATASGSLASLVAFGADGPAFDGHQGNDGFQFAVADQSTHDFGVTSHGQEVDFVTLSVVTDGADGAAQTLTAWTNGGAANGGHEVFTLTLNGDGTYTFTLVNPLDQTGDDTTAMTLDLSALVQAVDFDGDVVALSGDFTITVANDVPLLTGKIAPAGAVDEGALVQAPAGADQFGDGNDHALTGASAVASGTLAGDVAFGADGQALTTGGLAHGFQLAVTDGTANSALLPGITSQGQVISFYTVTTPEDGASQTLTAWAGGTQDDGGHAVFTLLLNGDGSYVFTLLNPLDEAAPGEDTTTLDLSALVKAVDFDGDAALLAPGDFTVTVTDDVPVLTSAQSGSVDEGGLTRTNPVLFITGGNDPGAAVEASGSLGVHFGADGPKSTAAVAFTDQANAANNLTVTDGNGNTVGLASLTSHGAAVHFELTSPQTLLAFTSLSGDEGGQIVFTVTLSSAGNGSYDFVLDQTLDQRFGGEDPLTLTFAYTATDFDGDTASGTFTVTDTDDVPVLTSNVATSGVIEEAALASASSPGDLYGAGNDPTHAHGLAVASGSLANLVSFGADGPQVGTSISRFGTTHFETGFLFAVADKSTFDFGVTSHGAAVNFVTLSGPTITGDPGPVVLANTLTAWTNGGPANDPNSHAVFTLTLDGDGRYTFTLLNPLDDIGANGDAVTLDLSGLVKAVDFDGDSVTLSGDFKITATDDVPLIGPAASGTVFEAGLTAATDPYGSGNHAGSASFATEAKGTLGIHFGADGQSIQSGTSETENLDTSASFNTFVANQHLGPTTDESHIGNIDYTLTIDRTPGIPLAVFTGTHGAVLGTSIAVSDAVGPFVLDHLGLGATTTSNVVLSGFDALGNLIASATVSVTASSNHLTNQVFNAAGTAFQDVQIAKLVVTDSDPNAAVIVDGVTVQTAISANSAPLRFTDETTAANNVTVTDGNGQPVALADLTSHGQALHFALLSPSELVAYAGGALTASDVVFTVTLSPGAANGSYDFVLDKPLDQSLSGADALHLSFDYTAKDFDGDTASGSFTVTTTDDVPVLTSAASGSVFESGLTAATDPFGTGNHAGSASFATEASGSLGIHFGADGPAIDPGTSVAPPHFTDRATAANNISVTDDNGQAVALADLTSHGQALHFALVNAATLVAFTGTDSSDPVFTVTLSSAAPNGSYDFVLHQPLDQPLTGGDALHLSFNYTAQDFDGDTASGAFTVTDIDDAPVLDGAATGLSSGVNEGGLSGGNDFGAPTIAGGASGQLDTLVHFGADGPNATPFQFVSNPSTALANLGIASHGAAVDFAVISTTATGTTLAAYTGNAPDQGGTEVFTLTLGDNGAWSFALLAPIDHDGNLTVDLSSLVQAVDFDGDAVGLAAGDLAITIADDAPSVSGAASGSAFEAGLGSATDPFGVGNHAGSASFAAEASGSLGLHFGADGPAASGSLHFTDTATAANNVTVTDSNGAAVSLANLTSHGLAVHFTLLDAETLVAYTGATAPTTINAASVVFSLTLSSAAPNGSYDFVLDKPLDQPLAGADGLHLSFNYTLKDFDGNTAASAFTVTAVDDAPIALTASGQVDESGLTSATDPYGTGTSPGAPTEASGTLVHYGADGPTFSTSQTDTFGIDSQTAYQNFSPPFAANFVFTNIAGYGFDPTTFPPRGDIAGIPGDTVTITDVAGPFVLNSIQLGTVDLGINTPNSGTVTLIGLDGQGDIVASATLTVTTIDTFDPATVFTAAGTAFAGVQLASLQIVPALSSREVLFNDISVTRTTPPPLSFTDLSIAANNVTVTDGNGQAVSLASLTSHGQALHFQLLNPETLVAFTGTDATQPVFTVTLSNTTTDGSYDFVLDRPLDELPGTGGALNLTFAYTARDFDGDATPGSFTVTAHDDVPFAHTVSATLAENGSATVPFESGTDYAVGADGLAFLSIDLANATFTSDPTNGHLVVPTFGQLNFGGTSLTLDPGTDFQALGAGQSATLDIPYTLEDVDESTATGHIVFTINGVNQAPVVTGGTTGQLLEDVNTGAPNPVANGGFEDSLSQLTHWTSTGITGIGTLHPHSGSENAVLLNDGSIPLPSLSQAVSTVAGQTYLLSFWALSSAANTSVDVEWNGLTVASFALPHSSTTYQEFFVELTGNGSQETLSFTYESVPNQDMSLDDVSLQPFLGAPTIGTNLVSNGGFETGFLTGWGLGDAVGLTSNAHGGAEAAVFEGGQGSLPSLTQTISSTVAGQHYLLSFWAKSAGSASFEVDWGGVQVASIALPTTSGAYQQFLLDVTGNGGAEALSFVYHSSVDQFMQLDDVSLQALASATPPAQTTRGTLTFADVDVNDTHTLAAPVAEGSGYVGTFTTGPLTESGGAGSMPWQFTVNRADIQFLALGQTLQQFYDLTISDGHGGSVTQKVEVDIVGTDDAPVFSGGATSGTVNEINLLTGSATLDSTSGVSNFTDPDLTDGSHTVSATYVAGSAVWSGATQQNLGIPQLTLTDLAKAMTAHVTAESTNGATGHVQWTVTLPDYDLDFLAQGETLTATYNVTVTDQTGLSSTEQVTVTFNGFDDKPGFAGGTLSGSIVEDSLPPNPNLATNGGFESIDVDGNSVGWSVSNSNDVTNVGITGHTGAFTQAESYLLFVNHTDSLSQTINTTAGQQYTLDFWVQPENSGTLTVDWNGVAVTTSLLGSSNAWQHETATFTGDGSPDSLSFVFSGSTFNSLVLDDVTVKKTVDTTVQTTSGSISFFDPDVNDTHSATSQAENNGQHADGTAYAGTLTLDPAVEAAGGGSVAWHFTVNRSDIQFIAAGHTEQQFYDVTISDGNGGTVVKTVEVDIGGAEDPPAVATADKTESASVQSGFGGTDTASGAIHFTDVDFTDRPTGSASPASITYTDANGQTLALTQTQINAIEGAFSVGQHPGNTNNGQVDWSFSLADSQLAFLTPNQTVALKENFTVDDHNGGTDTATVTLTILGPDRLPVITGATTPGSIVEDRAGSNLVLNGGFESGLANWSTTGSANDVLTSSFSQFAHSGNGSVSIQPRDNPTSSISQSFQTVAGQQYLLEFWTLSGAANSLVVAWNGASVGAITPFSTPNYVEHIYTLTGDGQVDVLSFTDVIKNTADFIDDISLTPLPIGPTQTTSGTISFSDADVGDTHTATFLAQSATHTDGTAYAGTFFLSPVTEANGSGSLGWKLTVDRDQIQSIPAGTVEKQFYDVTISDGRGGTTKQTIEVDLTGTNDAPLVDAKSATLAYTAHQPGIAIDTALAVSDVDSASLTGATVSITGNFHAGQDVLGFTNQNGITGSYNATTGVLTLSGTASVAAYQAALDSVTYSNSSLTPALDVRTISYQVNDGSADNALSNIATATVTITPVDNPPTFNAPAVSDAVTEDESFGPPVNVIVNGGFESWSYNSQTNTYTVPGWTTFTNQAFPPGVGSGAHSGSVAFNAAPANGQVATDSQAVTTEAGQLYKIDFFAVPTNGSGQITTNNTLSVLWDGVAVLAQTNIHSLSTTNPQSPSQYIEYTAFAYGTGTDTLTFAFTTSYYWFFDDVSVTQVLTPGTETRTGSIAFSDPDLGDTHPVTVTPNGSGYFGTFTPSFVDSTGTGTGAINWTFTVADSAIQQLAAGQTVTQTYTITISDGHGGVNSQAETITIAGINDAPVLSSTAKGALANEAVITTAPPTNLVSLPGFEGTLHGPWTLSTTDSFNDKIVSSHAHSGTRSMEFGQSTGLATITQGIATTAGTNYVLTFWLEDINPSQDTFNVNWNGQTVFAQFNGIVNSTSYAQYVVGVTATSSSSSLQFAGGSLNGFWYLDDVSVTPAPTGVTGTLVSSLVGINSGPGNVSDIDTGAKTGIAVTNVDSTNGTWFYSTDGVHWMAFGQVSTSNALLLAADATTSIYFQPKQNFVGTANLTFEAWDQATGSNGTFANASVTGGSSAFSSTSETVSVTVGTPTAGSTFTLTTSTDTVFYTSGSHTVTGSNTTLGTADKLNGAGADTLNLDLSGAASPYTFNFATMTGSFVGFSTLALNTNPGNSVGLTFGNKNILSGQTLTIDAHTSNKALTIDASGLTDGGSILVMAAANQSNNLTGGAGNDIFEFQSANLAATDAVNGGAGTDTLWVTDPSGLAVNTGVFAGASSIEVLKVGGAGTDVLNLGADASQMVGGAGHTLTIDDTIGTGALTVNGSAMTANMLIELTNAHFNASDSITGGSGSDTIQVVDSGGLTIADAAFTNVHGIETLKIGGSGTDIVAIGAAASADVGGAGQTFTVDDSTGTGPLTLSASGMTANVVIDLASANFTSADHITGGSGSDTIALVDTTGIVVSDAAFANVTGIETLKIGGAADDAVTLGANASQDVGGLGHLFTLDDSTGLGNLSVNASAMTADLKVLTGSGTDVVVGGSGNDTFFASLGNDIFTGGGGNNTYVFESLNLGNDQITDFNNTMRADQIQVSAAGFGGGLTQNQDVTGIFQTAANANFSGAGGGNGQFLFDTANHTLYYSANGTTGAEHAIAQIEAGMTVTPHDIHVAA